jgi:hypothetical protein
MESTAAGLLVQSAEIHEENGAASSATMEPEFPIVEETWQPPQEPKSASSDGRGQKRKAPAGAGAVQEQYAAPSDDRGKKRKALTGAEAQEQEAAPSYKEAPGYLLKRAQKEKPAAKKAKREEPSSEEKATGASKGESDGDVIDLCSDDSDVQVVELNPSPNGNGDSRGTIFKGGGGGGGGGGRGNGKVGKVGKVGKGNGKGLYSKEETSSEEDLKPIAKKRQLSEEEEDVGCGGVNTECKTAGQRQTVRSTVWDTSASYQELQYAQERRFTPLRKPGLILASALVHAGISSEAFGASGEADLTWEKLRVPDLKQVAFHVGVHIKSSVLKAGIIQTLQNEFTEGKFRDKSDNSDLACLCLTLSCHSGTISADGNGGCEPRYGDGCHAT